MFVDAFSRKWRPRASNKCPRDVPAVSRGLPEQPRIAPETSDFGTGFRKIPLNGGPGWPQGALRRSEARFWAKKQRRLWPRRSKKHWKIKRNFVKNQDRRQSEDRQQHTMFNTRHMTYNTGRNITHATCKLHPRQYETLGGVSIMDFPLLAGRTTRSPRQSWDQWPWPPGVVPETTQDAWGRSWTSRWNETTCFKTLRGVPWCFRTWFWN